MINIVLKHNTKNASNELTKYLPTWSLYINGVENFVDEIEINCQTTIVGDNIQCKAKHVHIGEINNKLKAIIL